MTNKPILPKLKSYRPDQIVVMVGGVVIIGLPEPTEDGQKVWDAMVKEHQASKAE